MLQRNLLARTHSYLRPLQLSPRTYHNGAVFLNGARGEEETPQVRFDSSEAVTRGKSTWEVMRGWLVFKLFAYDTLVDNSMKLYHFSKRVFGSWLTGKLLRSTAFGQFAGGVNEAETEEVVKSLAERNISSIWFFSIERDLEEVSVPGSQAEFEEQERIFDEVNQRYLRSIEMSASCNCDAAVRFAAVKLTAIVNPHLLNKLNKLLVASEDTFLSLASPGKNTVDRSITVEALHKAAPGLQLNGTGYNGEIGIADWTGYFSIAHDLHQFRELKSDTSSFSTMEMDQYTRFIQRLLSIGELAKSTGVRVLVDAEQVHFQAAIEHLTLHLLSRKHNSAQPVIYNTLQTYLVVRSLACPLMVRGCYMEYERRRAEELGQESPIHATKSLTDDSYHAALDHLMVEVKNETTCVMVASHNKETVRRALDLTKEHQISPGDSRVAFGQLLGMGDHLTYPLANSGYLANKVVPYGHMDNLIPFLSRRANENRGMIKNARDERLLYFQELKRRTANRK